MYHILFPQDLDSVGNPWRVQHSCAWRTYGYASHSILDVGGYCSCIMGGWVSRTVSVVFLYVRAQCTLDGKGIGKMIVCMVGTHLHFLLGDICWLGVTSCTFGGLVHFHSMLDVSGYCCALWGACRTVLVVFLSCMCLMPDWPERGGLQR
jgi:hypothetical protein